MTLLDWFSMPGIPPQASTFASQVDGLFLIVLALSVVLVAGLFAVLVYFCIRFRQGSPAPRSRAKINSLPIEVAWTVIPLVIFLVLFVMAGRQYAYMYSPPESGLNVYIVGKQWMWKMQHESGIREINQLHVPVNQDVIVTLSSEDVVHSFSVPAFRVKHDAVPGSYTRLWFRAIQPGTYPIFCTQYCGMNHSQMIGEVVVMTQGNYATWQTQQQPADTLAAGGAALFRQVGCSGCHAPGATIHAPLLEGLYGKPVALQSGQIATADRQYLRDSILLPNKDVAAGFAPVMPTYQGQLSEQQINELIAYIMSLRNQPAAPQKESLP
jgi:cytochrome c oxidase subunit 2